MTEKYKLIESIIEGHAEKIGAPREFLPSYGKPENKVQSYIEIDKRNVIHYVIRKNWFRVARKTSPHLKHIIFDVFDRITYLMAYEQLRNIQADNSKLRLEIFERQKELMRIINEDYVNWCEEKSSKYLRNNWVQQ